MQNKTCGFAARQIKVWKARPAKVMDEICLYISLHPAAVVLRSADAWV